MKHKEHNKEFARQEALLKELKQDLYQEKMDENFVNNLKHSLKDKFEEHKLQTGNKKTFFTLPLFTTAIAGALLIAIFFQPQKLNEYAAKDLPLPSEEAQISEDTSLQTNDDVKLNRNESKELSREDSPASQQALPPLEETVNSENNPGVKAPAVTNMDSSDEGSTEIEDAEEYESSSASIVAIYSIEVETHDKEKLKQKVASLLASVEGSSSSDGKHLQVSLKGTYKKALIDLLEAEGKVIYGKKEIMEAEGEYIQIRIQIKQK